MTNEELADAIDPRVRLNPGISGGGGGYVKLGGNNGRPTDGSYTCDAQDLIAASDALRQSATVRALAIDDAANAVGALAKAIDDHPATLQTALDKARRLAYVMAIADIRSLAPTPDLEAMVERGARALIDPAVEDSVSEIQGFLYGHHHVIRDCSKPPEEQELSRTIFREEHNERYEIERAKVQVRAVLDAMGFK